MPPEVALVEVMEGVDVSKVSLILNTFRLTNNPLLIKGNKIILGDIPFSVYGNPFKDINSSSFEKYKENEIQKFKKEIEKDYDVLIITNPYVLKENLKDKDIISDHPIGIYEEKLLGEINKLASLEIIKDTNYLFLSDLTKELKHRAGFSHFRNKYEKYLNDIKPVDTNNPNLLQFKKYLKEGHGHEYFETRNALFGKNFSTRLSHLLNLGLIHPSEVITLINEVEQKQGSNKSTYWIKFELLWREYFYALYDEEFFFTSMGFDGGENAIIPIKSKMYLENMNKNPLIRAMNKELQNTGFLSNRSRQIYASYLVNCTDLDWRYGAWWFQLHLHDYDLFSNWGNWLYLSGYGTDSKGPRFFNIIKQMKNYDPDLSYLKHWNEYKDSSWIEIDNSNV